MTSTQGDIMVGNVKSLVDRLSKDFSASRPPLSVHEPRKPLVSKSSQPLQHVVAAFAYTAVQDDELTLELGDVIEVLEEVEDGWSRGRQLRTNIVGMFPTNFVKPDAPPSSILSRDDDKVVIRRSTDPDQPEANRRTPSAIGGVNIFGGKTVLSEAKDDIKTKEMARVKFEYEPQHSDELKLGEIGQLVTIIRKDCGDAGWFEGEINGRRGLFPDNFVELVQVPISTQSGTIYHPPSSHHSKIISKTPLVNPPGMIPPAVPAKPLKQKLSESSTSINGAGVSPPSTTNMPSSPPVLPSQVKQQSSAFAAARNRISKDLIVGQPGQVSSKLTKSVIVTSGTEGVATSRPMSSVETDETADEVVSPLCHVTKTRARPPGKRPASMLLIKKKGSMDNLLESPSKPMAAELPEKSSFTSTVGAPLPSPVTSLSATREMHTVSPAPITPPVKVVPLRPPPAEIKLEEKKEHTTFLGDCRFPGRSQNLAAHQRTPSWRGTAGNAPFVLSISFGSPFASKWCGPCKMIAPVFESLSNRFMSMVFLKVDVDKCEETAAQNGVSAMPTFIVFVNGAKVDTLRGANTSGLEAMVQKWADTQPAGDVPGQSDITSLIDKKQMECLNGQDSTPLSGLLEVVKIAVIEITSSHSMAEWGNDDKTPKNVRIFSNLPKTLDFDGASSVEAVQVLEFSDKARTEPELLQLKYVKFQNVNNIQLFVESNQGGGDVTEIEQLKIFGTPLSGVNMNEFKRSLYRFSVVKIPPQLKYIVQQIPETVCFIWATPKPFLSLWLERKVKWVTKTVSSSVCVVVKNGFFADISSGTGNGFRETSCPSHHFVLLAKNKMDVERLMKDLTVDHLHQIQQNLQTEMEGKKEELREMVGRRYRDVLEASSEVRTVRELAEALADAVAHARTTQSVVEPRPLSREQQVSVQRFIALHRLLAMIGEPDGDALSDAFALFLAELLHKQLATEPLSTANFIAKITTESSSLLYVVTEVKKTLVVVEQLFAQGELVRIIQAAASPTYRPALIDSLICDEAFTFGRMLTAEAERVTRQLRDFKASPILSQKINSKCTEWINELYFRQPLYHYSVCGFAREPVMSICEFYDKADDIIEFLHAISGVLRSDWSRMIPYTTVYQGLFGDVLFRKFTGIISRDLRNLEDQLIEQLRSIDTAPPPLFEKSSNKFDSLTGVGISSALQGCISKFYVGVQKARECCGRYEQVELDSQPERVREALAAELFGVIERLSKLHPKSSDNISVNELSRARLCLALLHCDSTSFCQTMNKDGERISAASRLLNAAAEDSLSNFACSVAKECLSQQVLQPYVAAFTQPALGLQIALEWERLELPEVGVVEVPIVLSPPLQTALFTLSSRFGELCVAHLLSRAVRKRLSSEIANLLAATLNDAIQNTDAVQRTTIQLLFDCQVLQSMFPDEKLKNLIPLIKSRIDPFDLSLLSTHLATNVRLAVSRSQLLYSCLLIDILPNKDGQGSAHYSQVVDVLPKAEYSQRISLIPRLDRTAGENVAKRVEATRMPRNKLLANTNITGMKSTPSLSSFVDKISSSWFGSN
ncbi:hypothetical protein GCK32_002620 [Trichostrongylus colubriformis]|uniref:Uncharacterized protein n=1 Tax=Trichostrongylus colubriformis TaxID=6319 RepID=A0AAN8GB18_TRICO